MVMEAQKCEWVEHRGKQITIVKLQCMDKTGKKMEEEECKKSGDVRRDEIVNDVMCLLKVWDLFEG